MHKHWLVMHDSKLLLHALWLNACLLLSLRLILDIITYCENLDGVVKM